MLLYRGSVPGQPEPVPHRLLHLPVQESQGRPEEVPGDLSSDVFIESVFTSSHLTSRPARARITTAPFTRPRPSLQSTQTAHLTTQTTGQ